MHRIWMVALTASMFLGITGCGGSTGGSDVSSPLPVQPSQTVTSSSQNLALNAADWEIGPVINRVSSSVGMPPSPTPATNGFIIEFPQPSAAAGHVHYVTTRYGSLSGKRWMRMKFRIETDPGVKIAPTNYPTYIAQLTLYFQRRGDDWSAAGEYETYRWWASFKTQMPLQSGEFEIIAPFDERWTAVQTSNAIDGRTAFQAALANTERVGFTLGGGDGYGHGVFATGKARLIVTEFVVE